MKLIVNLHSAIRRNLYALERLFLAAGFTFLLSEIIHASRVYPIYWDTVILGSIFLLMLTWPEVGYFAFVLALAYPIARASIYPAALFLAIALIGQHWFTRNLDVLLLVLLAPFLNGIYLAWLPPLLAGLWWGGLSGLLAGIFSALWTKLLFGLIGASADYLALPGLYPDLGRLLARLNGIPTSLQFLQLPLQIFAPDSTMALYHLLQILGWGFCGWAIGELTLKDRVQYHRPRATMGLLALGVALLSAIHFGLALWLNPQNLRFLRDAVLMSAFPALGMSLIIELLTYFFEHPLPYTPAAITLPVSAPAPLDAPAPPSPSRPEPRSGHGIEENSDDDSVIMIELD